MDCIHCNGGGERWVYLFVFCVRRADGWQYLTCTGMPHFGGLAANNLPDRGTYGN